MSEISKINPWELPRFRRKSQAEKIPLHKRIWEGWKKAGLFIGKANIRILITVVYLTVFAVTAIIAKILGRDWLQLKEDEGNFWKDLPEEKDEPDNNYRQF